MPETTIHLPSPCPESWAAMTPTATGRHCASCQETVVDFTRMSEAEVVTFLRQYPAVSCGRFRNDQLDRPLRAPARAVGGWRRWWGATLALLGLGALAGPQARGQAAPPAYWGGPLPKNMTPPANAGAASAERPDSVARAQPAVANDIAALTIRGVVYNAHGKPQAGVTVSLWSAMSGDFDTTTDDQGRFQLVVPAAALGDEPNVGAYHWKEVGWYYQMASAAVDPTGQKPSLLYLKNHLKRKVHSAGKFR
ncbi:carboxypeptidase-like regulatory domain-containing protein [Hymenobacter sp. M29]|uniref:Carboxypeptidase-like regulatory domain-containing protein n=1 Tax=Hymenobacter mellowenesis TaxID=3063995 RepID=A0ABT9A5T7_9BACT|nr:carboxypeptidase-like regulatory domain-containing protein [Hymenobacter sp. M29]MDO7845204.1 carboxypeptidase-like regulatory domain-containing protein [Hymenobacter sp. M29]